MQQLFALIRVFREYLVVAACATVSIVLIANSDGTPVRVFRSYAIAMLAATQSSVSWLETSVSGRFENEALRDVNMGLMEEVMQLRRLRQENAELRRMLDFRSRSAHQLIPAEVVGRTYSVGQNTITISVGTDAGVAMSMPVITERGLVGKVIGASGGYAIVQLAINRDFRASSRVLRSRVDGIISWNDGTGLRLQNVWKTADVSVGDTVVTSEHSNTFPPEIPIGVITSIGPGEGGLFSRIDVKPNVRFEALERVFVVAFTRDAMRDTLEASFAQPDGQTP